MATSLYFHGLRYYDSQSGRFITQDPMSASSENPQSLNRYVYALDNPLVNSDPTGGMLLYGGLPAPYHQPIVHITIPTATTRAPTQFHPIPDTTQYAPTPGLEVQYGPVSRPTLGTNLQTLGEVLTLPTPRTPTTSPVNRAPISHLANQAYAAQIANINAMNTPQMALGGTMSAKPSTTTTTGWTSRQQSGYTDIAVGTVMMVGGFALAVFGPVYAPEFAPLEIDVGVAFFDTGAEFVREGIGELTTQ